MKSVIELEEIIVQGLQIDPRNYSAVQNWLKTTCLEGIEIEWGES